MATEVTLTAEQTIKGTVSAEQSVKGKMRDIPYLDNTLTKEGYSADAKAVGDALDKKAVGKAYISSNKDLNSVTESGMYRLGGSLVNAPSGASYGQLLVIHGGGDSIAQIAFDFTMARMWVRTGAPADVGGAGSWTNWAQCYTTAKKPTAADVGARPNTWMPTASDVGARPNTWLPTIAEIGAAPAGYGLGEVTAKYFPTTEAELNEILDSIMNNMPEGSVGFYRVLDNTGAVWGGGSLTAAVYKTTMDYATVEFYSYFADGARFSKTKHGGIWGGLINHSPSAFAPSGYGLGGNGRTINSNELLQHYTSTGFYSWVAGVADAPFYAGSMIVVKRTDNSINQIAFRDDLTTTEIAIRKSTDSAWSAWEWVNPPMTVGVEYRTTERWAGAPVYTQLASLGALPDGMSKQITINASSVSHVVEYNAVYTNGSRGEEIFSGGDVKTYYTISENNIMFSVYAPANSSQYWMEITFKYIKK